MGMVFQHYGFIWSYSKIAMSIISTCSDCYIEIMLKDVYLLCVFSNDSSNCNLRKMHLDIDCRDKVSHQREFSNDSSNCHSM